MFEQNCYCECLPFGIQLITFSMLLLHFSGCQHKFQFALNYGIVLHKLSIEIMLMQFVAYLSIVLVGNTMPFFKKERQIKGRNHMLCTNSVIQFEYCDISKCRWTCNYLIASIRFLRLFLIFHNFRLFPYRKYFF